VSASETIRLVREALDELEQASASDPASQDVIQLMRSREDRARRLELLTALLADWDDESGKPAWLRVGDRASI
jgi:hypothetical protein